MNETSSTSRTEVDLICSDLGNSERSPCVVNDAQCLFRLWKGLTNREQWFPGQMKWSADDDSFVQQLPPGFRTWPGSALPESSLGDWIIQVAEWIDELHQAGVRLNGMNTNSLVIDESGKLVGLCLPPCLTELATPVELVPLAGLNYGLAAPEIQQFTSLKAGPAADVFLLAALSFYLLTGASLRDLMRHEFTLLRANDPVGPATRAALEHALDLSPECRPLTATAFANEFREALWRDRSASEFCVDAAGRSEIGLGGRDSNEDAFCLHWESGQDSQGSWLRGLAVVADGMGGGERGERASGLCIDHIRRAWPEWLSTWRESGGAPETLTRFGAQWMVGLNQAALRLGDELETGGNFGSTLSALVFLGRLAVLLHVGDSRVFRLRRGEVTRLTEVQTGAELLARGEFSVGSAAPEELGHLLYSFVGSRRFEPQTECLSLEPDDVFLLCSDGPLEGLSEADIRESLTGRAATGAMHELFRRCHASLKFSSGLSESPGSLRIVESDNLTILVVRVTDSSLPIEEPQTTAGPASSMPQHRVESVGAEEPSEDPLASFLFL